MHVLVFYPLLTRLHIQDLHYIYAILTFPLPQENEALASAHNCSNQGQFFSPVLLFCFCFESVGEPEFESVGEPEFFSRYCDSLRARRFGDRVPVRARFSAPVQIGAGDHPVSYTMGTGRKAARAWSRQPISN